MAAPIARVDGGGHHRAKNENSHGQDIEAQAFGPEGGDETRADLQADGVHEEDEGEIAEELEDFRRRR